MPWKHEWVPPEEAFEIRMQCTEQQVQNHCDAHPDNDRRDFDANGGLQLVVYHAYKDDNACERLCWWYTLCDGTSGQDRSDLEFDIRDFPTFTEDLDHQTIMQSAYDNGLFTINDVFITITKGT
jgi:hypothetical protein